MSKYWQECEMPECTTDVPKAKGICDECTGREVSGSGGGD